MTVFTSEVIDAPIAKVWEIIADFANLKRWHPLVERCETQGSGEGAVRTVHLADWWASERLDRLDGANHVLGYRVVESSRLAIIGVQGTITLADAGDNRTRVDWRSGLEPDRAGATEINAGLKAYYPTRMNHLRVALGLKSRES